MGSVFRRDFSQIRLHTDAEAAQSAQDLDARAYTVQNHVVLGRDSHLGTPEGAYLLAHELAHTVQQRDVTSGSKASPEVDDVAGDGPAEREADAVAERATRGQRAAVGLSVGVDPVIQRNGRRRGLGQPSMRAPLSDAELLAALQRYPAGDPVTLFHVDADGRLIRGPASRFVGGGNAARRLLGVGEFWLTTNVEARAGFRGGRGLDRILAITVDRRFISFLADVAQPQLGVRRTQMALGYLFPGLDIPLPRVNYEGGGGGAITAGDVNIAIMSSRETPEFARLFELSIRRLVHMGFDPRRPAGSRLLPIRQLYPLLEAGTMATPPPTRSSPPGAPPAAPPEGTTPSEATGRRTNALPPTAAQPAEVREGPVPRVVAPASPAAETLPASGERLPAVAPRGSVAARPTSPAAEPATRPVRAAAPPSPTASSTPREAPMRAPGATTLRNLSRLSRIATAALHGLQVAGAVQMLTDFMSFAQMGMSGVGTILAHHRQAAESLAGRYHTVAEQYGRFSEDLNSFGFEVLGVQDPDTQARLAAQAHNLASDLEHRRDDERAFAGRLRQALTEVTSKRRAVESILDSPSATGSIAAATFGTATLAQLLLVDEDLIAVGGALTRCLGSMAELDDALTGDIQYLGGWFTLLIQRYGASQSTTSAP